jgi:hypothetical protein
MKQQAKVPNPEEALAKAKLERRIAAMLQERQLTALPGPHSVSKLREPQAMR